MTIDASGFVPQNGLTVNQAANEARRSQAIRPVVERPNPESSSSESAIILRPGTSEAFERADRFREQKQGTFKEFADGKARDAIYAYQSLAVESKREEIKGLLGVDTYV